MPNKEIEAQGIISLEVKRVAEVGRVPYLKVHCPEVNIAVAIPQSKVRGSHITQDLLAHIWDAAEIHMDSLEGASYQRTAYPKIWRDIIRAKEEGKSVISIIKAKQKPQDTSCT